MTIELNKSNSNISKMEECIERAVELNLFSGCVLVAKNGDVLFSKCCGESNKEYHISNALNTKFNVASITKPFTATAIMILSQKELLNLCDPVVDYLEDFPLGDKISIYHLLTHTAGLGDYEVDPEYVTNMNNIRNLQDILAIVYKRDRLFHEPGKDMAYSNSGAVVLGAIIEEITGKSYSTFLEESIFSPLNMSNTCHRYPEDVVENRASGYIRKMSGGYKNTHSLVTPPSPATGLLTTVEDLLLFDQALYKDDLLDEKHKKTMFTPFMKNYACGWGVFERFGNTVTGHSGGQPGFSSWFRRYTNDKYTIIILSNFDSGADSIFPAIEAILFGRDYEVPRIHVGEFLYRYIQKEGIETTINSIGTILERNNYQITDPETLNHFGYNLLMQDDPLMTLRFLLLNVSLFECVADIFDCFIKELSDYPLSTCLKLLATDEGPTNQLSRLRPFLTSRSMESRNEEIKDQLKIVLSKM